ncbi:hypothetical protein T310_8063, partial [Rasamsonia emersonii CBS 393.64]
MSYTYRERDREWDDYSRPSEPRSYTVRRYIIPPEDDRDREREVIYRRDDSSIGDRELVIRRKVERDDGDYDYRRDHRSERDYECEHCQITCQGQSLISRTARGPIYEPEYQVVHRSEVIDRDPRDVEYYYQRRVREYDDDRPLSRREISPHDSVSQVNRSRSHRDRERDRDYSSDESMVYVRKETREYDEDPNHRRHLAEGAGALIGVARVAVVPSRWMMVEVLTTITTTAITIIAVIVPDTAAAVVRPPSRGPRLWRALALVPLPWLVLLHWRARSLKTTGSEGAARGIAGGSVSSGDDARSSSHRNKRMAEAGLAGAAVAGLIEKARSRSRSRKGERSRSRSRIRKSLPIVAAGLGSAAIAGLYEKHKEKKEEEAAAERQRRQSRSRSRARSAIHPDPTRESPGLIEYGNDPVYGSIPTTDYYGRPATPQGYYSDAVVPADAGDAAYGAARHGRRHRHRHRSHSRGYSSDSSSESDRESRRSHRRQQKKERSSSRIRDLAEAGLAAAGVGYAASKYAERKEKKKKADKERHSRERERRRNESDREHDSYEEQYDHAPYAPSPPVGIAGEPAENYYPYTNRFPPPPGAHNLGEYRPPPS